MTEYIVEVLKGTDPVHKYGQLAGIYGKLSMSVDETLKYLADKNPEYPAQNDFQFSWNPLRGRNFCYARIVQDLTNKIGSGVYPEGTFLPHEPNWPNNMIFLYRQESSLLERRGFSKTLNAKGYPGLVTRRFRPISYITRQGGKKGDIDLSVFTAAHNIAHSPCCASGHATLSRRRCKRAGCPSQDIWKDHSLNDISSPC